MPVMGTHRVDLVNDWIPAAGDTQAKLLHNALRRFCDKIESQDMKTDRVTGVVGREVTWRYRTYYFRAKLATFDESQSIGEFSYRTPKDRDWHRLPTPYALAEKLTEAKDSAA